MQYKFLYWKCILNAFIVFATENKCVPYMEQILSTPFSLSVLYILYSSFPLLFMFVGRGGERQTHSCQSLSVGSEEGDRESPSGKRWRSREKLVRMKEVWRSLRVLNSFSLPKKDYYVYTTICFLLFLLYNLLFGWQRKVSGCDINVCVYGAVLSSTFKRLSRLHSFPLFPTHCTWLTNMLSVIPLLPHLSTQN